MGVGKGVVEEETRSGLPGVSSSGLDNYIHDDLRDPIPFPFRPDTPAPRRGVSSLIPSLPQTPAASLDLGAGTAGSATESDVHVPFTAENAEALKRIIDRSKWSCLP